MGMVRRSCLRQGVAGTVTQFAREAAVVDVIARRGSHARPLRYPGGKATLAGFFESTISALGLESPTYIEPYAGVLVPAWNSCSKASLGRSSST